jgi:membrane protein required for colicin V production
MEIYDTILLLLVLAAAFFGWRRGLATQVASIASIVISYLVAAHFSGQVSELIDAPPPWNTFAAMLALYLGTSLVIWLVFRQLRSSIEAMKLREFDRQLGALFGAGKGFILACVITLFAVTMLHEDQRRVIVQSKSGYLIAHFLNGATPMMPLEVRNFLGPYLERLDEELDYQPHPGLQADPGYPLPPTAEDRFPSSGYPSPQAPVAPPAYGQVPPPADTPQYLPPGGGWSQEPDWRATQPADDRRY